MSPPNKRFTLGLLVLTGFILLAGLLIMFGTFPDVFRRVRHYTVTFTDAPGAAAGIPVRRSGIRVGEVEGVDLDLDTGLVKVRIAVEAPYPLRQGDQATLVHGLLGGDTAIDLAPRPGPRRPGDQQLMAPGTCVAGRSQADIPTVLSQASGLVPPAQGTLQDLRGTLRRLDRLSEVMEDTLKEYRELARATRTLVPEFQGLARDTRGTLARVVQIFNEENQQNLAATLKNVRAGSNNLASLTYQTSELIKEAQVTVRRVGGSVQRADTVLAEVEEAVKPMPDHLRNIFKNLDQGSDRLNKFLGDVSEFWRGAASGNGSYKRFLSDPSLYNHLDDAACMLNRSLPRLDRILRDLEVFSDKIARHPEALGLGGVVRPSIGIKEAPSSYYRGP